MGLDEGEQRPAAVRCSPVRCSPVRCSPGGPPQHAGHAAAPAVLGLVAAGEDLDQGPVRVLRCRGHQRVGVIVEVEQLLERGLGQHDLARPGAGEHLTRGA
ncbi:hypothetical protein, partial [Candidatus Frankia alpina]